MTTQIERANQLYSEARFSEQQGNVNRAEVLYVESRDIFLQEGGLFCVDAADIMNTLASMKEMHGDYDGALRAAQKSIELLNPVAGDSRNRKADEVRLRAWCILSNIQFHFAQYDAAQQILKRALEHALKLFGETDEQTIVVRDQLAALQQFMAEPENAENL